jgi:hypothetical protein
MAGWISIDTYMIDMLLRCRAIDEGKLNMAKTLLEDCLAIRTDKARVYYGR